MTIQELSAKTVVELRKYAKENNIVLGAGIVKKSDILQKITDAMEQQPDVPAAPEAAPAPEAASAPQEEQPAPAPEAPAAKEESAQEAPKPAAQPQFRAAWHNPAPRYSAKPAYQAPAYPQRQGWQSNAPRTNAGAEPIRQTPVRPAGYTPRFGPGAAATPAESSVRHEEEYRTFRSEPARPAYAPQPERRPAFSAEAPRPYESQRPAYDAPRSFDQRPAYEQRPSFDAPRGFDQRPAYNAPARQNSYFNQDAAPAGELLNPSECGDGSGVLEMHPDGYGFLRSDAFLPSSRDIYVSMAQIRRFGLRTGDYVVGKTRPQRDGDKYTAMLYITEINGSQPDELPARAIFDELTPVYPTRRIDLESHDGPALDDMRLADLIAPLGFGQRGLVLCPPDADKTALLEHFANVISANHPDAKVMVLLIDECPEDVTLFREHVTCQVVASTFDQPPENHLRLADMVLERSQRLVEQGKDVVLIVDSLTRLAKIYTAAAQQGRNMTGMVNPASLFRAKKLFGAARCMKEGGSLTVIGAMNVETGSKVDDTVVEEFKGTANMELVLDASLARAGVVPPINLQLSGTKRAEALLSPAQQEGLGLIRGILSTTRSAAAIPQLLSLMDKAESNDALLVKIKDWVALMEKSR